MAYDVFNKVGGQTKSPTVGITRYARFNFNKGTTAIFRKDGIDRLLLLWDKENKKIGFKPPGKKDNDLRAYDIGFGGKGNSAYVSGKLFLDWIGYDYSVNRIFAVNWNEKEGVFEVKIPSEYLGGTPLARRDVQKQEKKTAR